MQNTMHPSIDFSPIFVDFWNQIRTKLGWKIDPKSHQKSNKKTIPTRKAPGGRLEASQKPLGARRSRRERRTTPWGNEVSPNAPVPGMHLYIRVVRTRAFKTHGFLLCLDVGYEFRLVDFGWWIWNSAGWIRPRYLFRCMCSPDSLGMPAAKSQHTI